MSPEPLPIEAVLRAFPDLAPDLPADAKPFPGRAVLLDVATTKPRAGCLTVGAYQLVGPDPEQVAGTFFDPRRVHAADAPPGAMDRDSFCDRILFRSVYKMPMRAALVAWDLSFLISRLARRVQVRTLKDGREIYRFVVWTYSNDQGEHTNFYRPRIDVAVSEAGRCLYSFTKRLRSSPGREANRGDLSDLIPEGETKPRKGYIYRGRFLSLSTAVCSLVGEGVSFAEACRLFEVPIPPPAFPAPENLQARMDSLAALYGAVIAEFALHPGPPYLAPDRAMSPSSIGKAYARAAGIPAPLTVEPAQPKRALGAAMASYLGARSEVRIRRVPLPVAYIDAHSMFPLVNALMRNGELLTHRVRVRHLLAPRTLAALRKRLEALGLRELLDAAVWPTLRGVALVWPSGQPLPTKARYGAGAEETTAVGPVEGAAEPMWVTYADLVAARLLGGEVPEIVEAWEWHPTERLQGLRPVRIRGSRTVFDPSGRGRGRNAFGDLSVALSAERLRLKLDPTVSPAERERARGGLKVAANSVGYGAEVEFNRRAQKKPFRAWGPHGPIEIPDSYPEPPGWLCSPADATFTVSGSRLLMAMVEQWVRAAGSAFVWMDTDGGCVPVTEQGGLIPCPGGPARDAKGRECVGALSRAQFEGIRRRFAPLVRGAGVPVPTEMWEPTAEGPKLVGETLQRSRGGGRVRTVFKLEDHNLDQDRIWRDGLECYAVSVKNYTVFRRDAAGNPVADPHSKFSAHAMGNLVSPVDPSTGDDSWIPEAWCWWLAREEGRPAPDPAWLDLPVMHELVVSSPIDYRDLRRLNRGKGHDEQIKPFDALLVAHVAHMLNPKDSPRRLVAPMEHDPSTWAELAFLDPDGGGDWRIKIRPASGSYRVWQRRSGTVFVESYRTYLEGHFTHAEPAALGSNGKSCGPETRGLLAPRSVRVDTESIVGKETTWLMQQLVGWRRSDQARSVWASGDELHAAILPALAGLSEKQIRALGFDPRWIRKLRSGTISFPRELALRRLASAILLSGPFDG